MDLNFLTVFFNFHYGPSGATVVRGWIPPLFQNVHTVDLDSRGQMNAVISQEIVLICTAYLKMWSLFAE